MFRKVYVYIFLFCTFLLVKGYTQTDSLAVESRWKKMRINGYLKDMNIVAIPTIRGNWNFDHLVHSRLNYSWDISKSFSLQIEARNRLFLGESVKKNVGFNGLLEQNLDYVKLGGTIVQEKSFILHAMIDRANLRYSKGKWEIIAGKQRINWSQSYAWNPNDIFNAYAFFDFDYEERRGTDAVLLAYSPTPLSSVQLASNIQDDWDSTVIATYFRFNKWNYDFQVLAGKYQTDFYTGIGWAGQIQSIGFSGELSYFEPFNIGSSGVFVGDLSFDYRFSNTLNLRLEAIYNSKPESALPGVSFLQPVTAKTLIFNGWSTFIAAGYDITPLLAINLNGIWNLDDESWFLNPSLSISLNKNSTLLIALQTFQGKPGSLYQGLGHYLYTRLKFNF